MVLQKKELLGVKKWQKQSKGSQNGKKKGIRDIWKEQGNHGTTFETMLLQKQGCRPGGAWHPQNLADQVTLSLPDYAHNIRYWHPRIFRPSYGPEKDMN